MAEQAVTLARIVGLGVCFFLSGCGKGVVAEAYRDSEYKSARFDRYEQTEGARIKLDGDYACADPTTQRLPARQTAKLIEKWRKEVSIDSYEPPQVVYRTPLAEYPKELVRKQKPGAVAILLLINTDGSVADAKVVCATDRAFESFAIKTTRGNRYEPGKMAGRPVRDVAWQPLVYGVD